MKKLALLIFTVIVSIGQIKAQEAGNTLLGGNFSFVSESSKIGYNTSNSTTHLSIVPVIGKMVNDKVAIGIGVGYFNNSPNYYYQGGKVLVVAPFIRIHNNITENFKFYIEPNLGKTFVFEDETDNKVQIYNAGVNFGLLYFISHKLSLELSVAGINYVRMSDKDYDYKSNSFSIDYDLATPNIGLKYYF